MKHTVRSLTFMFAVFAAATTSAQNWRDPLQDPNANFYDIQTNFYAEWGLKEQQNNQARLDNTLLQDKWPQNDPANPQTAPSMKGGYKQFKRWEYFMEPRVYPSGDITLPSSNYERFCDYLDNTPDAMAQYYSTYGQYPVRNGNTQVQHQGPPPVNPMSSTWTFMGPTGYPANGGAGRINVIRFDPTNANIMYAGAPAGGLWKSTNGGTTWAIVPSTDAIASIGVTDIAIDPTNNQIIYIATGDGDAGDTYSVGVLKSVDGGTTWAATGLAWTANQGRTIGRLLINPSNPQILMAFTNNGIYRTTTGGTGAWTQVQNTSAFRDGEFHPTNPNIVYGSGTRFWKSTDGGVTWTNTATGLPANTAVDRFSIAVTPANAAYVYILAGSAANNGFYGVYRSTDSGATFTQRSSTPNIMGWSSTGSDTGGQSWYDHGFDVSQTNADVVLVGGVNHWRSTNGGTNWTLNAHWTGTGAPYVHADVHCIIFAPGSGTRYFSGNDGGINETTNSGGAWSDRSAQLCIAQPYRIGQSASNPNLWITGHQDNGTNRFNGTWAEVMGGDGMDCFIDRTNNNNMYGEQYNGAFNRSTNGGGTWGGYTTGLTGAAAWVTPWCQDPTNAVYLWAGYSQVFRRNTTTGNWTQMGTITGTGTFVDIAVAPSNGAYVYAARSNQLWRSTNTGGTWTNITGTLPVGSAAISRIMIDPSDANNVWVTFSGYSAANKIFVTTNGGTSWTNISAGLPNIPANCCVYTPGSTNDAIYVGMDIGVYYRDNTTGAWAPYFTGLPNVPIFDLEIYAPLSKIRCASFGRGVWEVDVYNPGTLAPVADFTSNQTIVCVGTPVNFTDMSSFTPTSWSWAFQGGTPATSTAQNPTGITWSAPGTYSVTLTATNANGSDAETKLAYITVMANAVAPPLTEGFVSATFLPANWTARNINNDGIYWDRSATVGVAPTAGNSARFDNYNFDAAGTRDEMICPPQTFASMSSCSLTFDVAYARYNATYSDTLEVMVSTNCGTTWTQVWIKGGTTLATAPDQTASIFVPTAAQWRNENINLSAYLGQPNVLIKFVNHGRYGQAMYVDNVNIAGSAAALPSGTFTASATSVCAGTPVNFTSTSSGSPTSWSWTFPSGTPASATTQNVTGVVWNTAGTYTVTHTATNLSGPGTTTQVITVLANPTVTATASSGTICAGQSTTLTGGGASTYVWNPGAIPGSPVSVTPASTTTYTVTGTAANGCTSTATRTITVNPLPTVTASTSTPTICTTQSATLTATGASTYNWMPGSLSGTPVTVAPGATTTYTVTGTAATGCANTATVSVTVNTSPTVTASSSTTTICSGQSATLTGTGASTYNWMPGSLSGSPVTVSPAATTTYTVTGTAANGCTSTSTVAITVNTTPTVTATSSTTTICAGNTVTLTGSGASTYNWMPGSIPGSPVTVSPGSTTTYTVTGTAANGCTATATRTITVNPLPTVNATASSPTICTAQSATLTATGAATYNWMPGSLSGTPVTVTPGSTTTYTVTGTAATGCANTATVTVTVNTSPTVTASTSTTTICSGQSATLSASGASTYNWMPGSLSGTPVTVTPGSTTTYTVTGTAANGCTSQATQLITVNASPTVTASSSTTTICNSGSATLTATGASTYNWMPGSLSGTPVTVSPASTTTYTVTGTAANGCTGSATQVINVNPSPTVTVSTSSATICSGQSSSLTASGATTYTWMPGSLTGATVNVTPGSSTTYTVTGTSGGCSSTATQLITVNVSPTVTASAGSSSICSGNSTTLTATGATTYNWMPGSLSGSPVTVSPASTTTYTVTGTAANGCTSSATQGVTVTPTPTVSVTTSTNTICSGQSATMTATGGTTYTWMPGSLTGATVTVTPASSTTYTVTGTTAGCSGTATQVITVNTTPTVTASTSTTTICSGSSATLTASGAGSYNWMPGSLSGSPVTVTPATTTTYTVTGTAANGCTSTATQVINVNTSPSVGVSASTTSICTGGSTTLTGNGASTYNWMPGSLSGTSVVVTPAATTTYTVTGTAANGCTGTQTITISVGTSPTVTATAGSASICQGSSTSLTGNGATTYTWMPGSLTGTTVTVSPAATTTYTVTGTNGPGCSSTATVLVTVNTVPVVTASSSTTTVCSGSPVTFTGSGAATYNWMPGSLIGTVVTANPTANTTYTVTGTAANGCTDTYTFSISVNALPNLTVTPASTTICVGNSTTLVASPTTGPVSFSWSPAAGLSNPTASSPVATPTITTTYVCTKTINTTGCTRQDTAIVVVNAGPAMTLSSSSSAICTGGTATLTGTGAVSYTWNPGSLTGASVNVTPAATTTYTCTGTNASGCTSTQTITITVGPPPSVTASSSGPICIGSSATLTGSGAATYTWMPGSLSGTSVTVSPTVNTTYTVTGSNGPGCNGTATVTVVVNALPTVSATSSSPSVCVGSSATLTGSGATTYNWMPGSLSGTTVSVSPVSATTYTVTGTNVNGCSNTSTVSVGVNTLPTVTASSSTATVCQGSPVTLSGSGASTYNWMPGSLSGSTVSDTPASSTTYTVTGTDVNGCSNTATVGITVNGAPSVAASSNSSAVCAGGSVTLTGSGASTYSWMPGSLSGSPVSDAPASSTTYTVTGTDVNGCTNTATVAVTVHTLPGVTLTLVNDTFCAADGALPLSGGSPVGGTYSGPGVSGGMFDASSVGAGTYTVMYTYTDSNGCSNSATQQVVVDICNDMATPSPLLTVIHIIPNPNDGEFVLTFNIGTPDDYVIEIHNALGQVVYIEQLNTFSGTYSNKIDLKQYGRGAYTIRLRSTHNEVVERVITF